MSDERQGEQRTDQETRDKVNKLYTVFYENGFSEDMKRQADSLSKVETVVQEIRTDFKVFLAGRAATCPVQQTKVDDKKLTYALIGAGTAIFTSVIATVALVISML